MNTTAAGDPASGPRAKCDQVIFECISKAAEIIVASRGGGTDNPNSQSYASSYNPQQQQQHPSPPSSSTRFNLTLAENQALRSILQRWRRALHLPIRLDVYYQHEDDQNKRELLERWCLGYVQNPPDGTGAAFWPPQQDHIVQLRHVCKKIVIWLRTLYCFTKLLPATAFMNAKMQTILQQRGGSHNQKVPSLGFSLYAVSEDMDDITQLQEQGFSYQAQPAPPLTTPYGQLSFQVLYAKAETTQRLLPKPQPAFTPTQTIPIAINENNTYHQTAHDRMALPHHQRSDNRLEAKGIPQTAPAHFQYLSSEEGIRRPPPAAPEPQQNTYNPSYFTGRERTNSDEPGRQVGALTQQHGILQRRHTTIGDEASKTPTIAVPKGEEPQRVRSGLSLALMLDDQEKEKAATATSEGSSKQTDANSHNQDVSQAAEKRRAALHQMPPHLHQQQQQQQNSVSPNPNQVPNHSKEYGYAYNNHIPNQLSSTPPSAYPEARSASPSTGMLGTTPPLGVLYLNNPGSVPKSQHIPSSATTPPTLGNFIPPRNNSAGSVTPPFAQRPLGFASDATYPQQVSLPLAQHLPQDGESNQVDLPQLSSLDMLHHSPFHFIGGANTSGGISMLSSLSGGAAIAGSDAASLFYNHAAADSMRKSGVVEPMEDFEEMPFAVEDASPEPAASASFLASSAAVASFAQKCSTHQRLELFDKPQQQSLHTAQEGGSGGGDPVMDDLANQLADFQAFGASLQLGTAGPQELDNAAAASTSTPISLRS